ncbi:hypothetical protein BJY01DRAFT_229849 [Aspergillus pseudoustus]|uniref:Peptidase metallopeptidase domain-containing protein n=1 Tax=Aspergillus pseudoustus TaxID=1810923 RepID=A0ABR4IEP9_9EURO
MPGIEPTSTSASGASTTIPPSKIDLLEALRESVGPTGLKTLEKKDFTPESKQQLRSLVNASSSAAPPTRYTCSSETPRPVTLRGVNNRAAMQAGSNGVIPRWARLDTPQTINFATFANGYPRPGLALLSAAALRDAADKWNKLNLGVKFKWVEKLEEATFVLSYAGNQGTVLAEAFFPNENDLSYLNVYSASFEPGTVQFLTNIFLHELGHVLGFRHEFAPELEGDTVQFGPRNPLSVMGYEFPPDLQKSDEESAEAFYGFKGKAMGWKEVNVSKEYKKLLPIVDCIAR